MNLQITQLHQFLTVFFFNQLQTVHSYNTRQAAEGKICLTGVNTAQYEKRSAKHAGGFSGII